MWRHRLWTERYLVQLAMMLLLTRPFWAQAAAVRNQISLFAVANLLNERGLHVEASQVHLPARLVARSASPVLKIVSAQALGKDEMLIGVRCEAAGDCLPFNATVEVASGEALSALKGSLGRAAADKSKIAGRLMQQSSGSGSSSGSQMFAPAKVNAGSQVALVIRDGRMQIHLPAIAIDSGSTGARVRVRTIAPQKTFYGVVADPTTVLGVAQ
jgi:hypothetical protein